MQEFTIEKSDIPLWSKGNGSFVVRANVDDASKPLPVSDAPLLDASFKVDGGQDVQLGNNRSAALAVKAETDARIVPIWKDHSTAAGDLVATYDLNDALTDENMLLAFILGANADVSAAGSFRYNVLNAGASLEAGADASMVQVRAFPRTTTLRDSVTSLLQGLQLPSLIAHPPAKGEVVALEFGGFLNAGINASAGFQMQGSHSFDARELKLSETYALNLIGKLNVGARLAGRFSVRVTQGSTPGWARVVVRRSRESEFQVIADLNVDAKLDTAGLGQSGKEFLGALIGVKPMNWLNLIDSAADEAGSIQSLDALKAKLDPLAGDFISKYVGKSVDTLLPAEGKALLARLEKVVTSYRNLDSSAVALFDKYFGKLDTLAPVLQTLVSGAFSWESVKGEVDPVLWNAVETLTDGDPVGWLLGVIPGTGLPSLDELKKRAGGALSLIQDGPHEDLRGVIALAKNEFGLDPFLNILDSVDTPDKLKTMLSKEATHFVDRLLNLELDKLPPDKLQQAFKLVKQIVDKKNEFWNKFDTILQEAASQSLGLAIEAAYTSSRGRKALIDLEIRLEDENQHPVTEGQRFMEMAGRGDFVEILSNYRPEFVRLREGTLTHNVAGSSAVKINVSGWHRDYHYEELYRVIVNAEQQIRASGGGMLNVFTTIDLTDEKQKHRTRSKAEEEMHTNFLLRFLGETTSKIGDSRLDKRDMSYLVDVITGQSASYRVSFTDTNATPANLDAAMQFAKTVGLDSAGATSAALRPLLQLKNGNFGLMKAEYMVNFTEAGLRKMFARKLSKPELAQAIRNITSKFVVASFYSSRPPVAWLYASDDARKLWEDSGPNFVDAGSILDEALHDNRIRPMSPIPGVLPPASVPNSRPDRILLNSLFQVENSLRSAFGKLQDLLSSSGGIKLKDFRDVLEKLGDVLRTFDTLTSGDNPIFAVFDGLVLMNSTAAEARDCSLVVTLGAPPETHTVPFVLRDSAAQARAGGAGSAG